MVLLNDIFIDYFLFTTDYHKLFYYLCDLISYEMFFWNDLPADCLSEASCSGSGEKTLNV